MPHPAASPDGQPLKAHRVLCLQHSSIFERYGGVEYYLDDTLTLAASLYGEKAILSLVPDRSAKLALRPRAYEVEPVLFSRNRLLSKLENRFSMSYYKQAVLAVKRHQPTLILNAHVSLGPLAAAVSKYTKVPYVTVAYGIESWGNLWPQDEWSLRNADGILSISHWTKKILEGRGYEPERIQILHPGMIGEFPEETHQSRGQNPVFTLLSISRLDASEQYKGQDHVLQALSRLKVKAPELQFRYLIQGSGDDLPRLKELVRTLDLEGIVEFRAAVRDRDALRAIYQEADVFVMPSRYGYWDKKWRGEGFGIVYVEAAAEGVPSIAYACGGAMDIIKHDETGLLVEPDNIDELGRAIFSLAKDKAKLQRLSHQAYAHVKAHFTKEPLSRELAIAFNRF